MIIKGGRKVEIFINALYIGFQINFYTYLKMVILKRIKLNKNGYIFLPFFFFFAFIKM